MDSEVEVILQKDTFTTDDKDRLKTFVGDIIDKLPMDSQSGGGKGKGKKTPASKKNQSQGRVKVKGGANPELSPAVFNSGGLLNTLPPEVQANAFVPALSGPSPFSAGTSMSSTLDANLPQSYKDAMTGGKRRPKSGKASKSGKAAKP